jgi:hypothetical protein
MLSATKHGAPYYPYPASLPLLIRTAATAVGFAWTVEDSALFFLFEAAFNDNLDQTSACSVQPPPAGPIGVVYLYCDLCPASPVIGYPVDAVLTSKHLAAGIHLHHPSQCDPPALRGAPSGPPPGPRGRFRPPGPFVSSASRLKPPQIPSRGPLTRAGSPSPRRPTPRL